MDPASIAAVFVSQQAGQLQSALAAKFAKMNADQSAAMAQMIDDAARNASQLANLPSGIGKNLDVKA